MAATDKDIVISPQRGSATSQPSIVFTGDGNDPLTLRVLDSATGSLSIEGSAGQLFGVSNNLASGSVFSANYASGIPAIDVNASGVVSLVPTVGKVGIGTTNPQRNLDVRGGACFGYDESGDTYISKIFSSQHNSANRNKNIRIGLQDGSFAGMQVQNVQGSNASYNSQNVVLLTHNGAIVGDYPSIFCKYDGQVGIGTIGPSYKLDVNGQINTQQGSSISYSIGETYQIWNDNPEVSILDAPSAWRSMKTFIASKSGNLRLKFSGYIESGTYYWAWRIINQNASVVASGHYNSGLDTGETSAVHAYRRFVADLTTVQPGDTFTLQMVSSDGSGNAVLGVTAGSPVGGQRLFAKEFRAYSTTPSLDHGGSNNIWGNNVGIGTANPVHKVDIIPNSSSDSVIGLRVAQNWGSIATHMVRFDGNLTGTGDGNVLLVKGGGTRSDVETFEVQNGTGTTLVVKGSGNVGIGTDNPQEKLQVAGVVRIGVNTPTHETFRFTTQGVDDAKLIMKDSSNNEDVVINTGGSSWFNGGNVGIGTTNQTSKLAVNGFITESTDGGTNYWNVVTQQDVGTSPNQVPLNQYLGQLAFMDDFSPNGLRRDGGSTDDVVVNSIGNVGIGTTNPATELHLYTTNGWTNNTVGSSLIRLESTDTVGPALAFKNSSGSYWNVYHGSTNSFVGNNNLGFLYTDGVNAGGIGNVRVTFTSGGNVGIGTTNPQKPLEVIVSASNYASIGVASLGETQWCGLHFGYRENNTAYRKSVLAFERIDNAARGKIHILNNNDNNANSATLSDSRLTIQSDGNVGIGTTNPSRKLHVVGTSQFTSNLRIGSVIDTVPYDTLNNGTLSWEGSAGQLFSITNNLTTGSIFSVNDVSGIPSIDVDANGTIELAPFGGNVGIGTTNPVSKLDIWGGFNIQEGQHRLRVSNKFYEVYPIVHLHADNGNPAKTILTVDAWAGIYSTILITVEVWSTHSISEIATYARGGAVAHYNGTRSISALTAVTSFGGLGVGTIAWSGPSTAGSTGFSLTYTGPASNYTMSHIKITATSWDGAGITISNDFN